MFLRMAVLAVVLLSAVAPGLAALLQEVASDPTSKSQAQHLPNSFHPGQVFAPGTTPLTQVQGGLQTTTAPTPNVDGGYGWIFQKYHPSAWEADWAREAPKVQSGPGTPLCDLLNRMYARELNIYLRDLPRMTSNTPDMQCNGTVPTAPQEFDPKVFSRFEYVYGCLLPRCVKPTPPEGPLVGARRFTYIEPLVGLLRHPKVCSPDHSEILNKNYMIVDPWFLLNTGRADLSQEHRVFYFDAGASLWNAGVGGASQSWFYKLFESMCVSVTDWFMWESTPADARDVFALIPGHVKPGYRWYNVPIQMEADSWDNPLNHLLVHAKAEDTVIIKIDFDAPIVEEQLIQQIIDQPEVAKRIDELFFEHHINTEVMRESWGTGSCPRKHEDSLKMFGALRERGIRAHSWV